MRQSNRKCLNAFVFKLSLLAGFLVAATVPSTAQTFYGSIFGTVMDAGGAVIPAAATTLTNMGTQEHRTMLTDSIGNYRYVNLLPGSYRLEVEKSGFQRLDRPDIVVEVNNDVRIDATLQVGQTVQTIEVKAQTPLLQTDTIAVGQTINQPEEMPLNGRNPFALAELVPGVIPQGQAGQNPTLVNNTSWGNYQISGGIGNENEAYLDGAILNINYIDMVGLVPTQDSVQEFRVQTTDLNAEWGRYSGGVINMVTKSGSNQYHGAGYEYFRQTDLNANNFFANRAGLPVPAYHQNQFGADVGGPIKKDKSFFFFSFEGYRLRQGATTTATFPTAAMEEGNFTAAGIPPIYDALTTCGAPANPPGGDIAVSPPACAAGTTQYNRTQLSYGGTLNIIPPSRIDPVALKEAQAMYPAPTQAGLVNNFNRNYINGDDTNQEVGRFDQNLGDKQRLFVRYTAWSMPKIPGYPYGPVADPTVYSSNSLTQQAVIGDTYSFSPTTVADARVSWIRYGWHDHSITTGIDATTLGYPSYMNLIPNRMSPQVCIAGFSGWGCSAGWYNASNMDYSTSESLTMIRGKHTLKFGGEFRKMDDNYAQDNYPSGGFAFDNSLTSLNGLVPGGAAGAPSGYAFADYMLGYVSAQNPSWGPSAVWEEAMTSGHEWYDALYANDTYAVTPRLTVNLGVRYDMPFGWSEKHDRLNILQPNAENYLGSSQTGSQLMGNAELIGSSAFPGGHTYYDKWHLFQPRVGFAYRTPHDFVVRAAYGIVDLPMDGVMNSEGYAQPVNQRYTPMTTTENLGLTPYNTLSNPWPSFANTPNFLVPIQDNPSLLQSALLGTEVMAVEPQNPLGYVQQWNLNVEKELSPGTLLELGYIGTVGRKLPRNQQALDQLPDADLAQGSSLLNQVPNPFYGLVTLGALSDPTVAAEQLMRPYPEYVGFDNTAGPTGTTNYQALTVKFVKHFQSAGSILASYTWSKWMTNTETNTFWEEFVSGNTVAEVQNFNNLRHEWAASSNDVPHDLVVSYSLGLPFGQGKKFAGNASGPINRIVSGWGINGIYTLASGLPLVMYNASDNSYSYDNTGVNNASVGTQRPNIAAGCNPIIRGAATSRLGHWFNTSCFSQPAPFTYGNWPRTNANLRMAGVNNSDFALVKNMRATERVTAQFRAEFFNLWNRTQFATPGHEYGASNFGVVSSQLNQPRLAQFALRLEF